MSVKQAVSLGVIELPVKNGFRQGRQVVGAHLSVPGHHYGDVYVMIASPLIPGRNGPPNALVYFVFHQVDARIFCGLL